MRESEIMSPSCQLDKFRNHIFLASYREITYSDTADLQGAVMVALVRGRETDAMAPAIAPVSPIRKPGSNFACHWSINSSNLENKCPI